MTQNNKSSCPKPWDGRGRMLSGNTGCLFTMEILLLQQENDKKTFGKGKKFPGQ